MSAPLIQPAAAQPINPTSPLARGLKFASYGRNFLYDPVGKYSWTNNASMTRPMISGGPAWRGDGASMFLSRDEALVDTNRPFSMAVTCTPRAMNADTRLFSFGTNPDNTVIISIQFGQSTAANAEFLIRNAAGSTASAVTIGSLALNMESVLVATFDGSRLALHTAAGSGYATHSGVFTTNRTALAALLRGSGVSHAQADISMWALWERPLTPREALQVVRDPYAALWGRPKRYYPAAAVVGTSAFPMLSLIGVGG